jgi:hypothetical protein
MQADEMTAEGESGEEEMPQIDAAPIRRG